MTLLHLSVSVLEHMNLPNEEQQRIFLFYAFYLYIISELFKNNNPQWVNIISSLTHTDWLLIFTKWEMDIWSYHNFSKTGVRRIIKKFKESWKYWANYWEMGLKTPADSSEWLHQVGNCSLKEENPKNLKQEQTDKLGILSTWKESKYVTENLKSAAKLRQGRCFVFQHDNSPKHMTLLMKNFLYRSKVNITVWAPQRPPIEALWGEEQGPCQRSLRDLLKKNGLSWSFISTVVLVFVK